VKNKNDNDFASTFISLKNILKKYEKHLTVISDKPKNYNLNAGHDEKRRADIYFGGVVINKNYVSFHLMPVYVNPKLLDEISPDLKKRMQGKSCFNFKSTNEKLFKELSSLTKNGFEFYKKNKML
jgi:hypothetical protein